jgi:hypothetical protein
MTNVSFKFVAQTLRQLFSTKQFKAAAKKAAQPYKVYTAVISQVGATVPTAIVLENTFDTTLTWIRDGVGAFRLQSTGEFTVGKIAFFVTENDVNTIFELAGSNDPDYLSFLNQIADPLAPWDGISEKFIEIRVYP